jgi:hypothetical protein
MSDKLDPALAELLADPQIDIDRTIAVLIGLRAPASDVVLQELRDRGLTLRSVIGDVLTGSAPLSRMGAIAQQPEVVRIEVGGVLLPETLPPGG